MIDATDAEGDLPTPDVGTAGPARSDGRAGPDGLAEPISFDACYGSGADRTIVLGGGGVYFIAWQIAYLNGLVERGVALDDADIVVGTSAGSLVAGILTSGKLRGFGLKVDILARVPALVSALAPSSNLHPSQLRARDMFASADDSEPSTIRSIGHAALAAQATSASQLQRSTAVVMGVRRWRSSALQISTVDAYTGERLIIRDRDAVPLPRAAAASASVPGLFEPQQILDRRCMDGGVSGSGTHCDRVAGARRALVVSLIGGDTTHPAGMTSAADGQFAEFDRLRETGTAVHVVGPGGVDVEELMDPTAVSRALAHGGRQAEADASDVARFWNA